LGIIPSALADLLRHFIPQGITVSQLEAIMTYCLASSSPPKPMTHVTFVKCPFSDIHSLLDSLPSAHAMITGLTKIGPVSHDEAGGHVFLFVRDSQGILGIIDAQSGQQCRWKDECASMLHGFQDSSFFVMKGIISLGA
jgi:hypothetical protein